MPTRQINGLKNSDAVRAKAAELLKIIHEEQALPASSSDGRQSSAVVYKRAAKLLKFEGLIRLNSSCRLIVTSNGEKHIARHGYVIRP